MPNKPRSIQKTDNGRTEQLQLKQEDRGVAYYENLARITATLLAAILALLTFLLVVGVQNSIKGFSGPLYTALIVLGASLVLYVVGYIVREFYYATRAKFGDSEETTKQLRKKALAAKLLKGTHILQQLVFIASIGAVVWFAISYAELFLNPKPVQPPVSSQQGAPAPSGTQGPGPGETPEDHAKESSPQPTQ